MHLALRMQLRPEADFYLPGSCDFESLRYINDEICNNPFACNFEEEGECDFVSCLVLGCTNPGACNFDPEANTNDGSCEYMTCIGCTNPNACDFDPEALIAGVCYDYELCGMFGRICGQLRPRGHTGRGLLV